MSWSRKIAALPLLAVLFFGCAPKPVLYPNEHYQSQPPDQVQADIKECRAKARQYVHEHKGATVAGHTGAGAAVGAVMGVVAGAFTGDYTRAVSQGAAMGAASGTIGGAVRTSSPSDVSRRFVDYCLSQKGYQPIGWK